MSWLADYAPEGERERADIARLRAALASGDVWTRQALLHITGSAIVVHPPTTRVLLRWHERYQLWNHVGGHADDDEHDPWVTALREAEEETGLRDLRPWPGPQPAIVFVEIVPVPAATRGAGGPGSYSEPDHEHADVNYVLATDDPDAIAEEHDDAELRWLSFDEARSMVNYHVAELLDRVLSLF